MEWNLEYHEIGLAYHDRIIQINNDANLKSFLQNRYTKAYQLAAYIRKAYQQEMGKALQIETRSLAVEILVHFRLQQWTLKVERIFGKSKATAWMMLHMNIIDCGEKMVDNNRFVWDFMSIIHKK